MRVNTSLLLLCLALAFWTSSAFDRFVTLEEPHPVPIPQEWRMLHQTTPTSNHPVEVIFAIKHSQKASERLEELFWAVSEPSSERYGKHLTVDQLTELLAPSEERIAAVTAWLMEYGLQKYTWEWTLNKDMLIIRMPAYEVANLLNVQYNVFEHRATKAHYVGTLGPYWVPANMAQHIDLIGGVVGLPKIGSKYLTRPVNRPEGRTITPSVIRSRYNITANLLNTVESNSHAVAEFQQQFYAPSDLVNFFDQFVSVGGTYDKVAKVIGENDPTNPGLEAALDVEYLMGIAPNTTTWFISVAPFPFWSDLLKWIVILANHTDTPWVHTISYGSQGDYPSPAYRERLDKELQKVGVRGISIIFASGDSGSGCSDNCIFYPSYPATNIHVTSVGATKFVHGASGIEAAVDAYGSGGGFSQLFDLPKYQQAAVKHYFSTAPKLPSPASYNAKGRATPDVSALGDVEFEVIVGGSPTLVGGTSASAPTFGAVVTFLNQVRLHKGKRPLGFLNPLLYSLAASHPDSFFDVVLGNNYVDGCDCTGLTGFACIPGWDPVTGLGTPNFEVLRRLM